MKLFNFTIALALFVMQNADAQTGPTLAWLRTEFVENIDNKEPVTKVDAFGNVFAITMDTYHSPFAGYLLIKYDSLGNKLWERKYEGGIWQHLWQGFTIDQEGNAYVSINYGGGLPGFPDDAIITKYSPDGDVAWELNYGLNFTPKNTAAYMHADPTGLLYLFGYTYEPDFADNFLFTACLRQSDGAELWRSEYPGQFIAQNMRLLEDRLEVLATQYLPDGRYNFIQQVDLQGQVLQTSAKPDPAFYQADFNHIAPDGTVIYGNRGFLYAVTKVDARCDTVWHYSLPNVFGSSKNWVRAVTTDDSLNVYATGGWHRPGSYIDMVTTKLSKDGELRWQHVFSNQGDSLTETGDGIAVDEKYVYSIGSVQGQNFDFDLIVFVLDRQTGEMAYLYELDSLEKTAGNGVQVFQDGFVFCGQSDTPQVDETTRLITGYYKLPEMIDAANEAMGYRKGQLGISPNPASRHIMVDFGEGLRNIDKLQIVDPSGRCLKSLPYQGQGGEMQFEVGELSNGAYFLKVGHVVKKFLVM